MMTDQPVGAILLDDESRYDRQERISWWDQRKLLQAKVLVVGAGALGNEIVKNLALVGVGNLTIVDLDIIEHANLARCVFFRHSDRGAYKADVLAARVSDMNPDVHASAQSRPVERLGVGFLLDFDLVICGLDNRETRAWINQACRKLGITWIDGAIEGLQGLVRCFPPTGACYECTLGGNDRQAMEHRRSCALLSPAEMESGKVPTNATTSSIVAGVEVQEAIKILVGQPSLLALENRAWVLSGETMLTYQVEYPEDEYCMAHDSYNDLYKKAVSITCLADIIAAAPFTPEAIDFEEDLISVLPCETCNGGARTNFRSGVPLGAGLCQQCETPLQMTSRTSIFADDPLTKVSWHTFNPALYDVVTLRAAEQRVHFRVVSRPQS